MLWLDKYMLKLNAKIGNEYANLTYLHTGCLYTVSTIVQRKPNTKSCSEQLN